MLRFTSSRTKARPHLERAFQLSGGPHGVTHLKDVVKDNLRDAGSQDAFPFFVWKAELCSLARPFLFRGSWQSVVVQDGDCG